MKVRMTVVLERELDPAWYPSGDTIAEERKLLEDPDYLRDMISVAMYDHDPSWTLEPVTE